MSFHLEKFIDFNCFYFQREGGEKSHVVHPRGRGSNLDLPCTRRESPAAYHGGSLDKQAFPNQ